MAYDWPTPVDTALARLPEYNSDPKTDLNPYGMENDGHRTNFPLATADVATVANAIPDAVDAIEAFADEAEASATAAASAAANLTGTSTTTVSLSSGSKTFTTQSGKTFPAGSMLRASSDANPTTHWMDILVTSYSSTTLIGTVQAVRGNGSRSDWTIRPVGLPGFVTGYRYLWSTNGDATDPGTGTIKANNATLSSATGFHISETDFDGSTLSTLIARWDDSTSAEKARIRIEEITNKANWVEFAITGTLTDNGSWDTFPATYIGAGGSLGNGAMVAVTVDIAAAKGDPGATGPSYAATSVTSLAIGTGTKAFTTQTGLAYQVGARVRAVDASNVANWMEGPVTGYSSTTLTISADLISGSGTISNWTINLAGERGATGATGSPPTLSIGTVSEGAAAASFSGSAPAYVLNLTVPKGNTGTDGFAPGYAYTFSSTTTDSDPGAGNFRLNNATFGSVTKIFIDNVDGAGATVTSWLDSLDDSTSTVKGSLRFEKATDKNTYMEFSVTGSVVDKTGYRELTVTPLATAGTISNATAFVVSFARTGNAGAGAGEYLAEGSVTTGHIALFGTDPETQLKSGGLPFSGDYDDLTNKPTLGTAAAVNTGTSSGNVPVLDGSNKVAVALLPDASTSAKGVAELAIASEVAAGSSSSLAVTPASLLQTEVQVASASTTNIFAAASERVEITGTTTITAFDTATAGLQRLVRFAGILTLTHNGTSLICQTGANITTAADDTALVESLGSGNARVVWYQRKSGKPLTGPTVADISDATANGRSLISAANYAAMKTLLAVAVADITDATANGRSLISAANYAAMRALLDLEPGVDYQPYDANNAPVKGTQTLFIPAAAMVARTTNGAASFSTELATNDVMIRGYDFDASTAEAVQFSFSLPKQWNEGTIKFRAKWTAASGSGGVAFSLRARAVSNDDAMDGSWGTAITVTDTFITANDCHRTDESAAVTIGGSPAEGDLIFFEVTREVSNGSDTLAVDARLLEIELYITTDAGRDD